MTAAEFVKAVQDYYGPYPDGQKRFIAEFLKRQDEEHLDVLLDVLLQNVSSRWKKPPDIADFLEQGQKVKVVPKKVRAEIQKAIANYLATGIESPKEANDGN